jgi:hypothetical protein
VFLKLGRDPRELWLAKAREKVEQIHARRALGIEGDTSRTTVKEAIDDFIPVPLRFDLGDPGVRAQRGDAAGLGAESVPGLASGVDDGVVVVVQPQGEEALLHVLPHPLDRVELG